MLVVGIIVRLALEREGLEARVKWYSKRCHRVARSDYACFTVSINAVFTMPMLR